MRGLLKIRVNLGFLVNPFYLYCIAFSIPIIAYLLGWSKIFPGLSAYLILFFAVTFIIFIFAGYQLIQKRQDLFIRHPFNQYLYDIIFWLIILLCFINIFYMGYLPILDRTHNYREFGMPVVDPLFNSLCIFFSVNYFHSFLDTRKKKFIIYFLLILFIQIVLFRRSSIIWIITSSTFLFLLYKKKVSLLIITAGIISIPLLSYCFGLYGNARSKLSKSFVLNELGASDAFKNSGISYNHYMTYLYVSSPLANLQENINKRGEEVKKGDARDFLFYCLIPETFTIRLEKPLHLSPPVCNLITPELIAGSIFMVSFYTLGWYGMIIMFFYLFIFILLGSYVNRKWNTFGLEAFSLLSATVSLSIFSNFLNRLDVIMMLFIYPVLFHFIFTKPGKSAGSSFRILPTPKPLNAER